MNQLGDVLLLDVVLFVVSMLFGPSSALTVLIIEIFCTIAWILDKLN